VNFSGVAVGFAELRGSIITACSTAQTMILALQATKELSFHHLRQLLFLKLWYSNKLVHVFGSRPLHGMLLAYPGLSSRSHLIPILVRSVVVADAFSSWLKNSGMNFSKPKNVRKSSSHSLMARVPQMQNFFR